MFQEVAEECMCSRGNWPLVSEIHLDFDILQLQRLIFMIKNCFCVLDMRCPWAMDVISLVLGFLAYKLCKLVGNPYPSSHFKNYVKQPAVYFVLVPSECVTKASVF